MPVSAEFAYRSARRLMLGEADPWSALKLAPLIVPTDKIAKDSVYDADWQAFLPKAIVGFEVQEFVPEVLYDPGPPEVSYVPEVLPYAFLPTLPTPWTNDSEVAVAARTVAVIAWNQARARTELLFWEPVTVVTVEPTETFEVTELKFKLVELADL